MKKAYMNPEIELVEVTPLEMISRSGEEPTPPPPETPDHEWG